MDLQNYAVFEMLLKTSGFECRVYVRVKVENCFNINFISKYFLLYHVILHSADLICEFCLSSD